MAPAIASAPPGWNRSLALQTVTALHQIRRAHPSGALEEQRALARVAREPRRALELRPGLVRAAEPGEEVAPHGRQEVIALERGLRGQGIDDLESRRRTERHGVRDRAIQLHDG